MSLPDFELGPLEMEEVVASEPAIAPATARVRVDGEGYLLRLCEGRHRFHPTQFFFRLDFLGAPVVHDTSGISARSMQSVLHLPLQPDDMSFFFRRYLNSRQYERRMAFSLEHEMGLGIRADEFYWSKPVGSSGGIVFRLPNHQDNVDWLLRKSDAVIAVEVKKVLVDDQSDCSFARRWVEMTWDEQQRAVARFEHSDFDEFVQVMHWLAKANAKFWGNNSVCEWMIFLGEDKNALVAARQEAIYQLLPNCGTVFSSGVKGTLNVIDSYFQPAYATDLCTYSIIKHIVKVSNFEIYIGVPSPSHHERLEARLRLREWLQDKVAPEEIPALLEEQ